ncbi:MAG: HEAT repeat domain-containing protein [Abditibacteriales bacterium]|nr:HEAT repeat domain-containing protein [Abditibacteriales bacterium]MDW8364873.1 HEAT repeat domain-containing protein [Abditibacteriales bacterium]
MESPVQSRMNDLLRDLREGTPAQRRHAAQALRDHGAAAVEPLCHALRDKDLNVRVAAAESLGVIGDERAVQALIEALHAVFIWRSPQLQTMSGLLLLPGFLMLSVVALLLAATGVAGVQMLILEQIGQFPSAGAAATLGMIFGALSGCVILVMRDIIYGKIRRQNLLCHTIIMSLMRIGEKRPLPELRNILPDLRAIARDVLRHGEGTRAIARQAARRIEALTEQLKNLPLPAAAPAPDAATLPRVADANAPETERLPRV